MDRETLLLALGGLQSSVATAKLVYDNLGAPDAPLQALYAQIETLRLAVEATPDEGDEPDDRCPGCGSTDLEETLMGGGHYVVLCTACQDIVRQG